MKPASLSSHLVLAGDLTDEAIGSKLGDLELELSHPGAVSPFSLLDTWDGSIRKGGRALVETDRHLILQDGCGSVGQDGRGRGRFVADLPPGPVRDALQHLSPLRSLLSVGTGTAIRRRLLAKDDEGKTHARAELVTLLPEGDGVPVTLASLQGLRGYDASLRALSDHVAAGLPRVKDAGSLAALLFPDSIPYVAKPDLQADPDASAFAAAHGIIAAYLEVARRNEPGIIADHDTEFLHDYRVALRKIRSVVSLFKGVYSEQQAGTLKTDFSDLMAPTGRLRDLDVYLLGQADCYAMLPETLHGGLDLLFAMLARERKGEHRKIALWLQDPRYRDSVSALERLFESPDSLAKGPEADHQAQDYACALIWRRYRKVCRVAAGITGDTADEHVHELRILCKKLRYLIEFFAPILPAGKPGLLLKPLKALQNNLGLFNDYSVQQVSLRDVMDHRLSGGRRQDLVMAQSIGALIAVLHARQKDERAKVMSSFAQFDSPATRLMFRDLFHRKRA